MVDGYPRAIGKATSFPQKSMKPCAHNTAGERATRPGMESYDAAPFSCRMMALDRDVSIAPPFKIIAKQCARAGYDCVLRNLTRRYNREVRRVPCSDAQLCSKARFAVQLRGRKRPNTSPIGERTTHPLASPFPEIQSGRAARCAAILRLALAPAPRPIRNPH